MTSNRKCLVLGICFIFITIMSACGILPAEEEQIAPPLIEPQRQEYRTVVVERRDIVYAVRGNGTLESAETYALSYPDARKIEGIYIKSGDMVSKGDVLIISDTGDLDEQIVRQEYAVKDQEIAVNNQEMNVHRAEIAINTLHRETPYTEKKRGAGFPEKVELAQMDLTQARNVLAQSMLALEQARWELERLKFKYAEAKLVAPVSGEIVFVERIRTGEFSVPDSPLVSVAVPDILQVSFVTSDADVLARVRTGMAAEITYENVTYSGEVVMSGDTVPDEATPQLSRSILINVHNLPSDAVMGDQASVYIPAETSKDTLVIPRDALRTFMGQNKVYVMAPQNPEGSYEERSVELGIETDTEVEILAGLSEGEAVVLQ